MHTIYITSTGTFLPNSPIGNEEMEDYLGQINNQPSPVKQRILNQNGITSRYYALDKNQNSTHQNSEMAVNALNEALQKTALSPKEIDLLVTATTQGDIPVPGFASMVHAESGLSRCEIANMQSICTSGVMALKNAYSQLRVGENKNAICVASEFPSRLFKASRYDAQQIQSVPFDTEFLRWMLSDGAGAFVLETEKPIDRTSLKIDWIEIRSHANEFPLCMYTGKNNNKENTEPTWLDYPDYESAVKNGALNLKQDIRLLDKVIKSGVAHFFDLVDEKKIDPGKIDWLCCHYSSEFFKAPIKDLMQKGGVIIPEEKWFSNLTQKGNTGAASIYIMIDELLESGQLQQGETILCMVPESGRNITSFMQLTVEVPEKEKKKYPIRAPQSPELNVEKTETSEWLIRQLAKTWIDFETALLDISIIQKIHGGQLSLNDYKLLLHDLRQQVIDGSQWITRAASNISIDLFDVRSAFITHAATEHKDFLILEQNYKNIGGDLNDLVNGEKNIGSFALSNFMFQQANKPNPLDLLGAMFIIEGIGKRLAGFWGEMIKDQLNLEEKMVSFFTYHGIADEDHFKNLEKVLNHPKLNMEIAKRIAKTAKTTAHLYKMQLEELGNY